MAINTTITNLVNILKLMRMDMTGYFGDITARAVYLLGETGAERRAPIPG